MEKKRYALCGLSNRGIFNFALPILGLLKPGQNDFSSTSELVGILDLDRKRVDQFLEKTDRTISFYGAGEMEKMIQETKAETVLVGSPDYLHHEHIVEALKAGCDVIVEKPMAISREEVRRIQETEKDTGRSVTVAFNYRYLPQHQMIKKMIAGGKIGKVTNIEFTYNLDTLHGSSYFYRWNRERKKSGGLNVHKCCHHFDLVNWLIDDFPEQVFAFGKLNYFGPDGALRPRNADKTSMDPVSEKENCEIFQKHYAGKFPASDPSIVANTDPMAALSSEAQYPPEKRRYLYDPEIDIEDTYSVVVRYAEGASLNYSCNFCTPWEGYVLGINGTKGRIEAEYRTVPDIDGKFNRRKQKRLTFFPLFGGREEIEIDETSGGHGGADPIIQRDLFAGISKNSQELGLVAGSREGGIAVAMGEAVWISIRDNRPVTIDPTLQWAREA